MIVDKYKNKLPFFEELHRSRPDQIGTHLSLRPIHQSSSRQRPALSFLLQKKALKIDEEDGIIQRNEIIRLGI
jgi:hypothetical protein